MALASEIIGKARILLNDLVKVRWSDDNLLMWLNEGQRQIVAVRPDAHSKRFDLQMIEGIEQTIPVDGLRLLSVLHNVGGRAITLVSRDALNAIDLSWMTVTPRTPTRHYVFDDDSPKVFEVWPPAVAGEKVRINYTTLPQDCVTPADSIDMDGIYEGPLTDWVCYRAYLEETDSETSARSSAGYLNTFMQAIGAKTQADTANDPVRK